MHPHPLINNQALDFRLADLPCLIHGKQNSGASFFTVSLVADLYLHSCKILFFSARSAAREEFIKQTRLNNPVVIDTKQSLTGMEEEQVLFVESGNQEAFVRAVTELSDSNDRVILIKNIEEYDKQIFSVVKERSFAIFSGDIDKCSYRDVLLEKVYKTKILFSPPATGLEMPMPTLKKYQGFLVGKNKVGNVSLLLEDRYLEDYRQPEVWAKIGGKVIIINPEGKILLLKRSIKSIRAGGWDFPGGGVEYGENPTEAMIREIEEESGLETIEIKPIAVTTFPMMQVDQDFVVLIGYQAKVKKGEVKLSWEHDAYQWVTKEEALTDLLPDMLKALLKKI